MEYPKQYKSNYSEYTLSQGLDFPFSSNQLKQKKIARTVVDTVHKHNTSVNDLVENYLCLVEKNAFQGIRDSFLKKGFSENQWSGLFSDCSNKLKKMKNEELLLGEKSSKCIWQNPKAFDKNTKNLVEGVLKLVKIPYVVEVYSSENNDNWAFVKESDDSTMSKRLYLPKDVWGSCSHDENIVKKDDWYAQYILFHELTHLKERHNEQEDVWRLLLEDDYGDSKNKIYNDCFANCLLKIYEHRADLVPCLDKNSQDVALYGLKKDSRGMRSSAYISREDGLKIASLYYAEQDKEFKGRVLNSKALPLTTAGLNGLIKKNYI